jgi:predicted transcriptional regulator
MRSSLITILLSSEKRTEVLLLLKEKPRTIAEINEELNTNSVAILPQIKKLKEFELITHEDKIYDLSPLGKIIVKKIEPLIELIKQLDESCEDHLQGIKQKRVPSDFF